MGALAFAWDALLISDTPLEPPVQRARTRMRRRVLFVAGFDPRGAMGYYQRLSEATAPYALAGPLERLGPFASGWRWRSQDGTCETTFEFLHWDDIVDGHWRAKGRLGAQIAAMRALWVYARCGLLARAREGARAVRWALLAMGLAPLAFAGAALVLSLAVGALGPWFMPHGAWLAVPALAAGVFASDWAWRELNLEWLAKGFACIVETAQGESPNWDVRCDEFAQRIAAAAREGEADEIVVIGHSLGAILAMLSVHRYLGLTPSPRPILLATLGNIIPFYTWIEPGRAAMRAGVEVAASPAVEWIDVTSGSDPASACRMGPLVGSGAATPRWDPEFHRILTPERFRHIRRRPLDFHFQYLKGADAPDGFDLPRMMASSSPFFSQAPQ